MSVVSSLVDQIHACALEVSGRYKRAEAELVEILQQAEEHRVFLRRGHASLFAYVTAELGLGENIAYSLITVARKAGQVPALKARLQAGAMTLSNARRVAAVLTPQNQSEWIPKACELSSRELEREIVRVRPEESTPERSSYVTPERIRLELGLSERSMLRLRRAQDLLSQRRRRPVSLEETLEALTMEFLDRHDPVSRARRKRVRSGMSNAGARDEAWARDERSDSVGGLVTRRREPIPAAVLHEVNWRDRGRCTATLPDGRRCNQSRWIEIHHIRPVSQGGAHTAGNLTTLCSAHHRQSHLGNSPPTEWPRHQPPATD